MELEFTHTDIPARFLEDAGRGGVTIIKADERVRQIMLSCLSFRLKTCVFLPSMIQSYNLAICHPLKTITDVID